MLKQWTKNINYIKKNKNEIDPIHNDNVIKLGRRLKDYNKYIDEHPNASIVEMDIVVGKTENAYCIMTLCLK